MDEIKPCVYCQQAHARVIQAVLNGRGGYIVSCECGASSPIERSEEVAMQTWNDAFKLMSQAERRD